MMRTALTVITKTKPFPARWLGNLTLGISAAMLCMAASAKAATYSPLPGTGTLKSAANSAVAGDTISLSSGTYTETSSVAVRPGVSITGAGASSTTISGNFGGPLLSLTTSGAVVDGSATLSKFKIEGNNRALEGGILIENRNNVVIREINVTGCKRYGVRVWRPNSGASETQAPDAYITGFKLYDSTFTENGFDFPSSDPEGKQVSGVIQPGQLDGAEIYNNTIINTQTATVPGTSESYGVGGYGIKFKHPGWFKNIKVYNNNITQPAVKYGTPYTLGDGPDFTIELWNLVSNNLIYNNTFNTETSFINKVVGETGTSRTFKFYRNKLVPTVSGTQSGLAVEIAVANCEIYQNYIERFTFGVYLQAYAGSDGAGGGYLISPDNVLIHHNVIRNMQYRAINTTTPTFQNGATARDIMNLQIYNNFLEGSNVFEANGATRVNGFSFKNNILYNTSNLINDDESQTKVINRSLDSNFFYNSPKPSYGTNHLPSSGNSSSPGLNFSGTASDFDPYYRPSSSTSPVVNVGTTTNVHTAVSGFNVGNPDIGAIEYNSATVTIGAGAAAVTPTPTPTPTPTATPTPSGRDAFSNIQAESYNDQSGATNYGSNVGSFDQGDWMKFSSVNFGAGGIRSFIVALGTTSTTGQIEVRLGSTTGTLLGTLTVASTGAYGTFVEQSIPVSSTTGTQDVYLVAKNGYGVANIDYFKFANNANLLSNPGFESEQYSTQTPSGWSESSSVGGVGAGYSESGNAKSDNMHGTHYSSSSYNIYTYQTKTGLANGTYAARAWVRSNGGQTQCYLEAKDFGGTTKTVNIPNNWDWNQVVIPNIKVTNGQCTIGLWSNASGGRAIWFDDVEFFKQQ